MDLQPHGEERDGGEHQDEDDQSQHSDRQSLRVQRGDLVQWLGMRATEQKDQECPQPPSGPDHAQ